MNSTLVPCRLHIGARRYGTLMKTHWVRFHRCVLVARLERNELIEWIGRKRDDLATTVARPGMFLSGLDVTSSILSHHRRS